MKYLSAIILLLIFVTGCSVEKIDDNPYKITDSDSEKKVNVISDNYKD